MALLRARLDRALREGSPIALLCALDHPDGMVRIWSQIGTLKYGGYDWLGTGALGRITGIEDERINKVRQIGFELSGVPADAIRWLSSSVRNRQASVDLAALTPQNGVVDLPRNIARATLDYQELSSDDQGRVRIKITGTEAVNSVDRARGRFWTHEDQQVRFPGDTGLALISELAKKDIKWRRPEV